MDNENLEELISDKLSKIAELFLASQDEEKRNIIFVPVVVVLSNNNIDNYLGKRD